MALPPRRGAGPDTIPSTPLRQLSPALAPLLEPVYAVFRSTGAVPINYRGGRLHATLKPNKPPHVMKSYRPL
eukprot:3827626-Prorocentrum_lima.AAC.1